MQAFGELCFGDRFEPGEPIEDVSRESRLLSEPPFDAAARRESRFLPEPPPVDSLVKSDGLNLEDELERDGLVGRSGMALDGERSSCVFICSATANRTKECTSDRISMTWQSPKTSLRQLDPPTLSRSRHKKRTRQASLYRIAAANRSISFSFAPSTLRTVCAKAPDASASHVAQASSMHSSFLM